MYHSYQMDVFLLFILLVCYHFFEIVILALLTGRLNKTIISGMLQIITKKKNESNQIFR